MYLWNAITYCQLYASFDSDALVSINIFLNAALFLDLPTVIYPPIFDNFSLLNSSVQLWSLNSHCQLSAVSDSEVLENVKCSNSLKFFGILL